MSTTHRLSAAHEAFLADVMSRYNTGLRMDGTDAVDPAGPAGPAAGEGDQPAGDPAPVETPTETPAEGETPAGEQDTPWTDPAKAQAEIERLRRENASARTSAKETAATEARDALLADLMKVLNPEAAASEAAPTVESLTQTLTAAQADAQAARTEAMVTRAAVKAGADLDRLLDSKRFTDSIKDLTEVADIEAAVTAALVADASLKTVRVAGASTTDGPGGTAPQPTGVLAELARIQGKS